MRSRSNSASAARTCSCSLPAAKARSSASNYRRHQKHRTRLLEVAPVLTRINDQDVALLAVLLTLAGAGALYQTVAARRHGGRFAPPRVLIDVGGHRLHTVCRGPGSPIVLLESGIAASSLSWTLVQPEIATFTRVCAYDRAGLAWSDAPSCPRTFDRIVNELAAVLATSRVDDRCILVGHSFGSFVVRAYAARRPVACGGLVLVDPPTEWLTMTEQRARMLWGGRICRGLAGCWRASGWCARAWRSSPAARQAHHGGSSGSSVQPPRERSSAWSAKCASFRPTFTRLSRRSGVSRNASTPWRTTCGAGRDGHDGHLIHRVSFRCRDLQWDQPPEQIAAHRALAESSFNGRHVAGRGASLGPVRRAGIDCVRGPGDRRVATVWLAHASRVPAAQYMSSAIIAPTFRLGGNRTALLSRPTQ